MPTLDVKKWQWITAREKAQARAVLDKAFYKALEGLVPPYSQEEFKLMRSDPWRYVTEKVKQPPPKEAIPEIIQKTTEAMPVAFHGTPHQWAENKPDISKVGTGQGAQSYGHGLYFAENPEVAKTYTPSILERFGIELKGKEIGRALARTQGRSNTVEWNGQTLSNYEFAQRFAAGEIDTSKLPAKIAQLIEKPIGSMYQVNIPDEQVAKMLDWDKPLSEQGPEILKSLERLPIPEQSKAQVRYDKMTGKAIYKFLTDLEINYKEHGWPGQIGASDMLKEAGIPGIKYLDQGSRAAGQGTRNFVVFDPDIIKDVKKK